MSKNTKVPRAEILQPRRDSWKLFLPEQQSEIYALSIIDVSRKGVIDPNNRPFSEPFVSEFRFKMNPQTIEQDEPPAVTIVPTQNKGQYIEHQGQIYKNIVVSGTTGLRPNKHKNGGLEPVDFFSPELASNERTGFDDILDLINLFRTYYGAKESPEWAHRIIMIWQNGKEGEFYEVEPTAFKTTRDASSPLTIKYEFTVRTIKRIDSGDSIIMGRKDPHKERKAADNYYARLLGYRTTLSQALANIESTYKSAVTWLALKVSSFIQPVKSVLSFLISASRTTQRALLIPRSNLVSLISDVSGFMEELEDFTGSFKEFGKNNVFASLKHVFNLLLRSLTGIASEDKLFDPPLSSVINRKRFSYTDIFGNDTDSGGDDTDLNNTPGANSAKEELVQGGDTIRKVAKRLLGSSGKWKTLVILNNLKPPYISATGDGVNVLRPGDRIKYPSLDFVDGGSGVSKEKKKPKNISEGDSIYGRDLRLERTQTDGEIDIFDIQVINGDLALVEGVDNIRQAMEIRSRTEQGELSLHEEFGLRLPVGVKNLGARSFTEFQMSARSSFLSDSRISTVDRLRLTSSGNVTRLTVGVTLRGTSRKLALNTDLRR